MSNTPSPLAETLKTHEQALHQPLAACVQTAHTQGRDSTPTLPFHYLHEALRANAPSLFTAYLQWRFAQEAGDIQVPMQQALTCIRRILAEEFPEYQGRIQDFIQASAYLVQGPETPEQAFPHPDNPLGSLAAAYLQALLQSDRKKAGNLIQEAVDQGTAIRDIYLHVFQSTQYEIGRLWQKNQATVAQEHFCTAVTQLIMTRLYDRIFAMERRGRSLVATCVGGELHELGMRMVADFFEMDGWDTMYLGAGSSTKNLLTAVDERHPQVVGISATMTSHVHRVEELIAAIKERFPSEVKILVGGYPFLSTPGLWQQVGGDGFGQDAREAVGAANAFFDRSGRETA